MHYAGDVGMETISLRQTVTPGSLLLASNKSTPETAIRCYANVLLFSRRHRVHCILLFWYTLKNNFITHFNKNLHDYSLSLSQVLSLKGASCLLQVARPQHPPLSTLTTLLSYSPYYLLASFSPVSWIASRNAPHCFHSFAIQAHCCSEGRKDYRVTNV